jgi:hypothetical protein
MTMSVASNPAVTDPRTVLKPAQQQALLAVAFYRDQKFRGGVWHVGDKRFSPATIDVLVKDHKLLRPSGRGLAPTLAGQLAADRLKQETKR